MKQFFLPVTEPLGAIWALMLLGLVLLVCKRNWLGVAVLGVPAGLLFLVGSTGIADLVVSAAERPYATSAPLGSNSYNCVIALGGGHSVSRHDLNGFTISEAGDRYLAGAALVKRAAAPMLVLGGSGEGKDNPGVPESIVVQHWLETAGLIQGAITNLGVCHTTRDEAVAAKALMAAHGWTNALLVTSALHMPRAEALFRKTGVPVKPFACDFRSFGVARNRNFSIFPRRERLELLSLYFHEKVGWLVYWVRGWV